MSASQATKGAVAGIKVLDLTRILAGPFCTMLLGDMGADVVKIENPGSGDDTRGWGPPFAGTESAYFLGVNRNKRSVTLNLKSERGQEILRDLIRRADVVIENFKAGALDKWGCGRAFMEKEAPQVVHCTISGYGSRGLKAKLPGYDFLLQAESGLMSITGEPNGDPMKLGVAIVDVCTGMYATICILAALNARNAGVPGQHIGVSLYTTGLSMLANVASNVLISGKPAGRYGNGHPSIVPYSTYRCADGDIALAVGNDAQFGLFAGVVGHLEWVTDARFARNRDRVVNRAEMDALITAALRYRKAADWIELLLAAGVPCGLINNAIDALAAPQTKAMNMVVDIPHPSVGTYRSLGIPFDLTGTPAEIRRPAPTLGQHTDEVLAEYLGLGQDDLRKLREAAVI
ncbi:MAG: CoA transferase [Rhizobiales bacterium]|nr:CoA transferase [Hyphomicrobiales bacterium]